MSTILFDGQQTDEKILAILKPHPIRKIVSVTGILLLSPVLFVIFFAISALVPQLATLLLGGGMLVILGLLIGGIWWTKIFNEKTRTYITDRRIIRFEAVSPFFQAKRALFWNEVLKAKAYSSTMLYRMFNVGTVQIEPVMSDHENIFVHDVYMFEDMANYIDKILFIFKNKPAEIGSIRPFIAKPKGQRS